MKHTSSVARLVLSMGVAGSLFIGIASAESGVSTSARITELRREIEQSLLRLRDFEANLKRLQALVGDVGSAISSADLSVKLSLAETSRAVNDPTTSEVMVTKTGARPIPEYTLNLTFEYLEGGVSRGSAGSPYYFRTISFGEGDGIHTYGAKVRCDAADAGKTVRIRATVAVPGSGVSSASGVADLVCQGAGPVAQPVSLTPIPDLLIEKIEVAGPTSITVGGFFEFVGTVKNGGSARASEHSSAYTVRNVGTGTNVIGWGTVGSGALGSGDISLARFRWQCETPGTYMAVFKADSSAQVAESNEGNNEKSSGVVACNAVGAPAAQEPVASSLAPLRLALSFSNRSASWESLPRLELALGNSGFISVGLSRSGSSNIPKHRVKLLAGSQEIGSSFLLPEWSSTATGYSTFFSIKCDASDVGKELAITAKAISESGAELGSGAAGVLKCLSAGGSPASASSAGGSTPPAAPPASVQAPTPPAATPPAPTPPAAP
ncbi:MAG: hypothetical protein HY536_01065, partial [Candidatus Colwellbacteria bacterium]|nr:hypothetical protein [Candidatus Colwellbacteria bacterium]